MLSAGCAAYRWHELVSGSSEEREKQAWNAKGKYQAGHVEVESTDVFVCGRPLRSSDEVSVMGMERRGRRAWWISASNLCEFGGSRKAQHRSIGMKRWMKQLFEVN